MGLHSAANTLSALGVICMKWRFSHSRGWRQSAIILMSNNMERVIGSSKTFTSNKARITAQHLSRAALKSAH
jgi:hypothetical protein